MALLIKIPVACCCVQGTPPPPFQPKTSKRVVFPSLKVCQTHRQITDVDEGNCTVLSSQILCVNRFWNTVQSGLGSGGNFVLFLFLSHGESMCLTSLTNKSEKYFKPYHLFSIATAEGSLRGKITATNGGFLYKQDENECLMCDATFFTCLH